MPVVESTVASARPFEGTSAEPVAALRGATVVLDDRAVLRRADMDLFPGITVLRGANGAGKTTALRALAGLVPLSRGSRDVPQDVLYLGHRPQLLHGLTARENLRFFMEFRGPTARAVTWGTHPGHPPRTPLDHALDRWGLLADADRPVEQLSAGQRRRAALARLDLEWCELVLLDEPFAELDAEAAGILRDSLADPLPGVAVLIASHAHTELDDLAARVYVVGEGAMTLARSSR